MQDDALDSLVKGAAQPLIEASALLGAALITWIAGLTNPHVESQRQTSHKCITTQNN